MKHSSILSFYFFEEEMNKNKKPEANHEPGPSCEHFNCSLKRKKGCNRKNSFFFSFFVQWAFSELLKSRVFSICRAFFLRPFFEFS